MHFEEAAVPTPCELRLEKIRIDIHEPQLWNGLIHGLSDRGLNQGHNWIEVGVHFRDTARLIDNAPMPKGNFRWPEARFVGNGVLKKLLRRRSADEVVNYNDGCRIRQHYCFLLVAAG
jgi:hypothetical protein